MHDILVEIQTEELPPKSLRRLALDWVNHVKKNLTNQHLSFEQIDFFATPRRLALLIKKAQDKQEDTVLERKGPALKAAYDAQGQPTPACLGFAKSCGVEVNKLQTLHTQQGDWVGFKQKVKGKTLKELLPQLIEESLIQLPIAKKMRWGNQTIEFVRPIHSLILLMGNKVIPADILGYRTDRKTHGHPFLSKGWVSIPSPAVYLETLRTQFVIADFEERKNLIRNLALDLAQNELGHHAHVLIDEALLEEVTGLVEWPVPICGSFDPNFLAVPQEAIISAMQDHQRYFPVVDAEGKLLPHFIGISNIKSKNTAHVIEGNENVLRARLSDAAFFFETDKKIKLMDRLDILKTMVFHQKLGSLYDKTERLVHLTQYIARSVQADSKQAEKAALLAKTDLTTHMVGEFPELQGVAGYYYALAEGETDAVAKAIYEQYYPRFSGDSVAKTPLGSCLSLADRIDTLMGIFGIHQNPTGDKDPYGLRRAALGLLRILIENQLNIDLLALLEQAKKTYGNVIQNSEVVAEVLQFILERLKAWYQEQGITADVLAAVNALRITSPYDMHLRIAAVQSFKNLPEGLALSTVNKRVSNILSKYSEEIDAAIPIDAALFEEAIEKILAEAVHSQKQAIFTLRKNGNYSEILTQLALLREPVDLFFDKVLVMTEDTERRQNRLRLLKQLRELFLQVADIALLQ